MAQDIAHIQTNQGNIDIELNRERAPKTVANFERYAREGFYNGTIFHRVIKGFMIQGGGFTPNLVQKATHSPITNEAANGLKNEPYTIAMARTANPNSATSQFFINVNNNQSLNYRSPTIQGIGYAVFGRVIKGQEVVDKIAAAPTTSQQGYDDVPQTPIIIQRISIEQR